jgi:hypothetical protein
VVLSGHEISGGIDVVWNILVNTFGAIIVTMLINTIQASRRHARARRRNIFLSGEIHNPCSEAINLFGPFPTLAVISGKAGGEAGRRRAWEPKWVERVILKYHVRVYPAAPLARTHLIR